MQYTHVIYMWTRYSKHIRNLINIFYLVYKPVIMVLFCNKSSIICENNRYFMYQNGINMCDWRNF